MKKALLSALLVMVAASLCLAQTDSLPAPTAEDTMKANPVAVKTTECPDKKWIIGFEATSLDLEDLPGTVFLQRKVSPKFFVGAGFHYDRTHYGPDKEYDFDDSTGSFDEQNNWTVTLSPEIGYSGLFVSGLEGGLSVRLNLSRRRYVSEHRYWDDGYYYYRSSSSHQSDYFDYGLKIPVFLEKKFRIKKLPVAVGITNNLLSVAGGWVKHKSRSSYESYFWTVPDVDEDEESNKQPGTFTLDNPFQGNVRIFIKIYM